MNYDKVITVLKVVFADRSFFTFLSLQTNILSAIKKQGGKKVNEKKYAVPFEKYT
jgi:hypothetical protein